MNVLHLYIRLHTCNLAKKKTKNKNGYNIDLINLQSEMVNNFFAKAGAMFSLLNVTMCVSQTYETILIILRLSGAPVFYFNKLNIQCIKNYVCQPSEENWYYNFQNSYYN